MIVLGVDTVGAAAGVALWEPRGVHASRNLGERGRHAETLVPAILELFEESGRTWDDVRGLAVNEGPGSFTGLRVGIAFVLGVSHARGIPAVGLGCLDILARACYDANDLSTGTYILGATDVRRGEVALARFRCGPEGPRREEEDMLVAVHDAGPPPPGGSVLAGDGAPLLWPLADGLRRWSGSGSERALAACRLGVPILAGGHPGTPVPRYARPPGTGSRRPG